METIFLVDPFEAFYTFGNKERLFQLNTITSIVLRQMHHMISVDSAIWMVQIQCVPIKNDPVLYLNGERHG